MFEKQTCNRITLMFWNSPSPNHNTRLRSYCDVVWGHQNTKKNDNLKWTLIILVVLAVSRYTHVYVHEVYVDIPVTFLANVQSKYFLVVLLCDVTYEKSSHHFDLPKVQWAIRPYKTHLCTRNFESVALPILILCAIGYNTNRANIRGKINILLYTHREGDF